MKMHFGLTLVSMAAFGVWSPGTVAAQSDSPPEILSREAGFSVDISGCPDASRNVRAVHIDDTIIDVQEAPAPGGTSRLFGPGATHWGQARIACASGPSSKELKAWFDECSGGKNIRKNITVTLYKSDRTPGRSYLLVDCFPVGWAVGTDAEAREAVETVTVEPSSIVHVPGTVKSDGSARGTAAAPDDAVRAFEVGLSWTGGKEVDVAWESCDGGGVIIPTADSTAAKEKFATTSPGHKSVNTVVLRGAMTNKRSAICGWINDTTQGKRWKRDMTITELHSLGAAGKTVSYFDGFPVRYKYPDMSIQKRTGTYVEEVSVRQTRSPQLPADAVGRINIEGSPKTPTINFVINDVDMDTALVGLTGDARNPSAVIYMPAGGSPELLDWYKQTADGSVKTRQITIDVSSPSDPTYRRSINLHECFPVGYSVGSDDKIEGKTNAGKVQSEKCKFKVGYIEFKT